MREVRLPEDVGGRLWLGAMPGLHQPLGEVVEAMTRVGVERVVGLTSSEEIEERAPEYYRMIGKGGLKWEQESFPIDDFGVPEDEEALLDLCRRLARRLRGGERVVIHCGVGVGRTGMVAACVLIALGLDRDEAVARVRAAGSDPETEEQRELVAWAAEELESNDR